MNQTCCIKSKLICSLCEHYEYCDKAKRCDGKCYDCDIKFCENNPNYLDYIKEIKNMEEQKNDSRKK